MPREHPFELDARLSACANFVRKGVPIADVGTDHAYLPVWLVRRNITPRAIAVDIRLSPLQIARETIDKYRCADQIEVRQSDGLANVWPYEVNDVVIAGMGGENIMGIINGTTWLRDPQRHLILQPMTKAERLRQYLFEHGFDILLEYPVRDGHRLYTVMLAVFSGKALYPGMVQCYSGAVMAGNSPYAGAYLQQQADRLKKMCDGLKEANKPPSEYREFEMTAAKLELLILQ